MSASATYAATRDRIETYFDRTALDAWEKLTSDAPVSRVRATVRAGRDRMRATLLDWLPSDLSGRRILDAGCGTGAFAVEAARRGAEVVAIDVSPSLISIACSRQPADVQGKVRFLAGDMCAKSLGRFDHVVAMDSLIHYEAAEMIAALEGLSARTDISILFTFAPRTPLLKLMHIMGKLFPRGDRSPAIVPVAIDRLRSRLDDVPSWATARDHRVNSGFYMSHALELVRW